jgi:hypothetical protein
VAPDPVDRLYDLPPGEFTPARDALAKALKAAGDGDGAAAVKALRKPSAAAWAINRAAREDAKALRALLAAGEGLRSAQADLLKGKADRDALRGAGEAERAAVAAMLAVAGEVARAAGSPLSPASETRIRETLHAAALDEDVREALAAGRLEREAEASGFAGGLVAAGPRSRASSKRDKPATAAGRTAPERAAAKREAERLKQAREAARGALAEASKVARAAEQAADAAARRLERAESSLADARDRLAGAEARERTEREECEIAQRALRAAKGEAAAAQAALDQLG